MLGEKHFEEKAGGIVLNDKGRKQFVAQMLEKLNATLMYKPWGEKYLTGDLSGWNCISLRNILWRAGI